MFRAGSAPGELRPAIAPRFLEADKGMKMHNRNRLLAFASPQMRATLDRFHLEQARRHDKG